MFIRFYQVKQNASVKNKCILFNDVGLSFNLWLPGLIELCLIILSNDLKMILLQQESTRTLTNLSCFFCSSSGFSLKPEFVSSAGK